MKKSTKAAIGIGAVVLLVAGFKDIMNLDTKGLRLAHQAAGWHAGKPTHSIECESIQDAGNTWALCSYWRGTPTVWLKKGEGWATANGPALMMIEHVASIDTTDESRPYQDLPMLYRGSGSPGMPVSVQARMNEMRNERI